MVTKCVCSDVLFSEMKVVADKNKVNNITELKEFIRFGENCRLCTPYIELMLKTGKTEFKPVIE